MSYRIRLEPSGHEFNSEHGESLLEAALRSGINPQYSCSNGSCGDCRARVVHGEVAQHMAGDFHFSEQEKAQGFVMLCTTAARSDLVLEASEAHSTQDIPEQHILVKLLKMELVSEKVAVLHLRTPRSKTLRFLAGQHVRLRLADLPPLDATVASCPCNGMHLYFHIHRDHDHPLVESLFRGVAYGTELELSGPYGNLSLDDDSRRPLLMIALGTDFAVLKSLVEHALNLELAQPLRLFWLSDAATGHYLDNYCRAWHDELDDFAFNELTIAAPLPNQEEMENLFAQLAQALPSVAAADIYLAGPEAFAAATSDGLLQLGVDPSRLFIFHRRQAIR